MHYSLHPEALKEYLDAVFYYADVSPRLARAFVKAIEAGIDDILRQPQAWQCIEDDIRF
jgi:plasmid stabilization system protein ParE